MVPGTKIEQLSAYFSSLAWGVSHGVERVKNTTQHVVTYTHGGSSVRLTAITKPKSYKVEATGKEAENIVYGFLHPKSVYQSLTGTESFIGKPRRIALTDRSVLMKKNYSVTNKVHGDRHLFYVDKYGVPSFVTKQLEFVPVHGDKLFPDYAGTLIDGELYRGTFYATDLLFEKGRDVRGKKLTQRLKSLFDILMELKLGVLRMNVFFVQEEDDKVYEYPGGKLTQFKNLHNAAKNVFATKKSALVFVPVVDHKESTFEWNTPSFGEYVLKTGLENFFETRSTLEKLLLDIHSRLGKGERFKGHALTDDDAPLIGQKLVNFKKFKLVMNKWDFALDKSRSEGSKIHFEFVKK